MANKKFSYIIPLLADWNPLRKQLAEFEGDISKLGQSERAEIKRALQERIAAIEKAAKETKANSTGGILTAKLEKEVKELKQELKTLKEVFPADEFAKRNGTITQSFAKMDEQLRELKGTTEGFKNDIAELRTNFEDLFKSVKSGSVSFGKSLDVSSVMKASLRALGKTDEEIKKATESLEGYKSALKELSGKTRINPAIKDDVGALTAKVEELMAAEQKLSGQGKTETAEYAKTVKQMMAYEKRRLALGQKPMLTINGDKLQDDFGYFQKTIEKVVQKISDEIARLEGQLDKLGDTFAKKLSAELETINVKFAIDDKSKTALKNEINKFVQELSNGKLDKIKLKFDNAMDGKDIDIVGTKKFNHDVETIDQQIEKTKTHLDDLLKKHSEESQKLGNLRNEHENQPVQTGIVNALKKEIEEQQELLAKLYASQESSMHGTVASVIRGLDKIDSVIDDKTATWRSKIAGAFKLDKGEIKVPFTAESSAEVIFNEVQNFFNDNEIDLHLNKEAFVNEIKQAVAEGGVSVGGVGGGTVALDEKTMAMAIATGLQAFFTGDFTPVTGEKKTVKGVQEPKKTHTYFDPSNPFNRDVANSLSEVLKAGTQKGGGKIKEFFSSRGIDVEKMANASAGELLEMLGQLTDRYGATIADRFKELMSDLGKNSASSKVGNFLGDFRELLYTNRISQTTVDDSIKKKKQLDLWENYSKKSVLDSGLGWLSGLTKGSLDISKLGTDKGKKIPTIEDIDEYIGVASNYANKDGLDAINQQIEDIRAKIAQAESEGKEKEAASLGRQLASLQSKQREMQSQFDYYDPIVKMLETVKEARSALTDMSDDGQKREFVNAVKNFQSTIGNIRKDLAEELNGYSWGLEIEGSKGIENVDGKNATGKASRLYRGVLGRDNSKVKAAHLYAAPDAQRDWLDPRPDRTAIRNVDTTIPEFKLKENTEKRWEEENTAAVEASKRATESAKLVADTEKRLADGAQAESAIKTQIEELAQQRATDEATIAANEEELANIADKKEARKAKKRAETLDARLEAARKEKADAERQADKYKNTDYSARDAEEQAIDAEIRKLKKWQKDPEKYRDNQDLIDMLYAEEMDRAEEDWKQKKLNEKLLKANFESSDKYLEQQIASQEGFAKRAREQGNVEAAIAIEKNIEELKNARAELPKTIVEAVKAREEAEKKFVAILDKIDGQTDEDKAAFTEDAQAKLGARIRAKQAEKEHLPPNMRTDAASRLQKTDVDIAKLEAEKAQLVETQEYKDAQRIEQLEAENKEAKNRIKDGKTQVKDLKVQAKNLTPEKTTQQLLDSQNENVDEIAKDIVELDSKLQNAKEETAKIEAYVDSVINDEKYKKPDGEIKHTKKNDNIVKKYNEASKKANYLNKLINNEEISSDERFANFNPEEQTMVDSINKDRTYLRYIDKMRSVLKDETGQYQDPNLIYKELTEIFGEIESANKENQARAEAEGATEHEKARAAWSQKLVDEVSTFMEEYRAGGIIDGAGAENFFEAYWEQMVGSLRENIFKQSDSLKPIVDTNVEIANTLKPDVDAADQHLKETYIKRVKSWFKKINEKKKIVDKGEAEGADEVAKNAAGLAAKEITDLFPLITKAMSEYKNKFGEELVLAENDAKLLEDKNKYHYGSYISKKTSNIKDDLDSKRDSILNSERETLLKTRRGELLKEISGAKSEGKDTKELETALKGVNDELAKYQKYTTILSNDAISSVFYEDKEFAKEYSAQLEKIIEQENELDLAQAQGASQAEIAKKYDSINSARIEAEDILRKKLKDKQIALLEDIKTNKADGKSVTELVKQLDLVNKELVELEVNHSRRSQTSISGDLYKASESSVKSYTSALKEAIIAKQKLNKLEAEGADTKNAAKESKKAENRVREAINYAVNERINGPANTDPRTQALDYLDATEDPYLKTLAKKADAERRKKQAETELENLRTDDSYSTSNQYKRHYNSIKRELTNSYVHSDDYTEDRDAALQAVETEFIKEVAKKFGTDEAGNLSEKGQKVLYEFWNNQRGKRAEKLDPSQFKETLGRLMQNGTDDPNEDNELNKARKEAEDEFKNSQTYKNIVAAREKVLSDALEAPKEALRQAYDASRSGTEVNDAELQNKFNLIDQEVAENIKFLRETTVENYPLLKEEINKLLDGKNPTAKEYENAVATARGRLIQQEKTKAIERKNAEAYNKYKVEEAAISKPILKETNALLRDATEDYIEEFFKKWIESAFTDDVFAGDSDAEEIIKVFKSLMEEKVYGLASKHGKKLEVRDGFLSGADLSEYDQNRFVTDDAGNIDVQKTIEKRLEARRKIAEEDLTKAEAEIADAERKRKDAMKKGGLSDEDARDAETKKELAEFLAKITAEKERQAELTAEIARLEKEGASVEELGAIRGQLDQTNANIDKFEKFIHNRELLIEMNRKAAEDEKKIQAYTLDEQKLFYESKRAKAEERLGSEDAKVREKAEADIARFDDILGRIATKMEAEAAKEREKNDPMNIIANKFASAIKAALGGNGGLNVDATGLATEATLAQILAALTGGQVVDNPAYKEAVATIEALEKKYGGAPSEKKADGGKAHENSSQSNKQKTPSTPKSKYADDFDFVSALNKQRDEMQKHNKGTKEYVLEQAKLYRLLWDYKNNTADLKTLKNDKFLERGEVKALGLDPALIKSADRTQAFKDAGGTGNLNTEVNKFINDLKIPIEEATKESEKQLKNEQTATAESNKRVENEKKANVKLPKTYEEYRDVFEQYLAAVQNTDKVMKERGPGPWVGEAKDAEEALADVINQVVWNANAQVVQHQGVATHLSWNKSRGADWVFEWFAKIAGFKKNATKTSKAEETKPETQKDSAKDVVNKAWKAVPSYDAKEETFTSLQKKAVALKGELDTLYDEGKKDTVEFIQKQTELGRVMSLMRKKYSENHPEVYGVKGDKESNKVASETWQKYLITSARGRSKTFESLDGVQLTSISKAEFSSLLKPLVGETKEQPKDTSKEKPEEIKVKDFEDFKKQVNDLVKVIGEQEGNAEAQRKAQEQLIEVLRVWAKTDPNKISGVITDKHTMPTAKEWDAYLTDKDPKKNVLASVDTKKIPLTNKQLNKLSATSKDDVKPAQEVANAKKEEAKAATEAAKATKEQAAAEKEIQYSKKDLEAYEKAKKVPAQIVQTVDTNEEIGIGALAKDKTLVKILEIIQRIQTEGIKKGGSTTAKKRVTKTDEATLIMQRALKDKAAIAGIGGSSKAFGEYDALANELENKVKGMKCLKDAEKAIALNDIKTLAQKISALGFNIMKDSSEWDYKLTQADKLGTLNVGDGSDVRTEMENLAKANAGGKQYEFLNFDGKTLSYQLTDIKGNVEKVTMEWSELNNQVAITSDKSVAKLETLSGRLGAFSEKFENASQMGYLDKNGKEFTNYDSKLRTLNSEISKISEKDIITEEDYAQIERLKNEALRAADDVTKKIASNKKLYSGTTEMNAVTKQYNNLESSGILEEADLTMVEEYKNKYRELTKLHDDLKSGEDSLGLLDEEAQKELLKTSLEAKKLGKELEKAFANSQRLKQLTKDSGSFNGKDIGDYSPLQEGVDVYDAMRAKLEELGAANIKVDRVHQKATGTIRHNNKLVSDLEVSYDELTGSLARYTKQERESLTGIPAFLNGFQKKINSIMQYLSMTMSIHQVMAEFRKGIQYVREIDLALTELKKVTDETEATYDKFLDTAAKTGARLGTTISAVTEATATFAKLGYSMEQATEMAESAIVYKNVGDNIESTEDAANSIISTMKGFKLEETESMAIVDRFNEVKFLPPYTVMYMTKMAISEKF